MKSLMPCILKTVHFKTYICVLRLFIIFWPKKFPVAFMTPTYLGKLLNLKVWHFINHYVFSKSNNINTAL